MAFQFSLDAVLRVRTLREEREERMLGQILAEISQTTKLLEELDASLQRMNTDQHAKQSAQRSGSEVHAHYGELASLRQNKAELRLHLEKLEELKDRQLRIYHASRQNREMLTDLEKTQRASHTSWIAKREQTMTDDNFAARYRRD